MICSSSLSSTLASWLAGTSVHLDRKAERPLRSVFNSLRAVKCKCGIIIPGDVSTVNSFIRACLPAVHVTIFTVDFEIDVHSTQHVLN